MDTYLSANILLSHVRALADEIGPRPAGHPAEMRARQYIRQILCELGYDAPETLTFPAPDTWGYAMLGPLLLGLLANALGKSRPARLLGGLTTLGAAYLLWDATRVGKQPLTALAPRRPSATLILRIPPAGAARRKVVLLAHTDTNKHRLSFTPGMKKSLLGATTFGLGALLGNGLAQLAQGFGGGKSAERFRQGSALAMGVTLGVELLDERGSYVDGASDNASAVACALGLAAQLRAAPLQHTEVWLAFTGAEEVGCMGAHALLDAYGDTLRDAWFLDFEMVGAEQIAYVTQHTGFSLLSAYTPDAESLTWAEETARHHPELGVAGRNLVIGEEVGALRKRGYRGVCIAGYGPDGWLENWHQYADNTQNLVPAGLEKAARFGWAMLQGLDGRA